MNDPVIIGDPNPGGAGATLLAGDVREVLRGLPAASVHCCITSPPYWGLRAYSTAPQVWGGREDCEHEWNAEPIMDKRGTQLGKAITGDLRGQGRGDSCQRCGAWRGELGQEPTIELYVRHLVEICREVRRVLREDGVFWLNLGDCYAHSGACGGESPDGPRRPREHDNAAQSKRGGTMSDGLKPKDLCMIPSRVALALQADGWWVRSKIPWLKRNPMPESAQDRPTSAVEYVYLLTKSASYFYDGEAGRMPGAGVSGGACFGKQPGRNSRFFQDRDPAHPTERKQREDIHAAGAQSRTYDRPEYRTRARRNSDSFFESWQGLYDEGDGPLALIVNPAAYKEAHFATFPPKLVEPMVKVGTSEKGCCPKCGKPWGRVVNVAYRKNRPSAGDDPRSRDEDRLDTARGHGGWKGNNLLRDARTLGWHPGCECGGEPVPCTALDPFSGAGTTAMVAAQLGRRAIGIDLSEKYNRMAATRIGKALNPLTFVDEDAEVELPLLTEKSP